MNVQRSVLFKGWSNYSIVSGPAIVAPKRSSTAWTSSPEGLYFESEVSDAEAIFVEAASSATDAEPEDQLRMFFQSHKIGSSNKDGITAGSLFNLARECGADFSPWEKTSAVSGQAVVVYVPGKEEQCRKRIDLIVAADPRTFTLGSPSGPLVILRVPDKETLPSTTTWDGDLPGTTLALTADIMQRRPWEAVGGCHASTIPASSTSFPDMIPKRDYFTIGRLASTSR